MPYFLEFSSQTMQLVIDIVLRTFSKRRHHYQALPEIRSNTAEVGVISGVRAGFASLVIVMLKLGRETGSVWLNPDFCIPPLMYTISTTKENISQKTLAFRITFPSFITGNMRN
jgi:hypothetical protein